jgi:hypothetical protein
MKQREIVSAEAEDETGCNLQHESKSPRVDDGQMKEPLWKQRSRPRPDGEPSR